MSDPLTEAVRRLRQLQEDVERLKSGDEGESRILRLINEPTIVSDVVSARLNDTEVVDRTNIGDLVTARLNDVGISDQTNIGDTTDTRRNDREVSDRARADDSVTTTTGNGAGFTWADHSGSGGDQWDLTEWQNH